MFSGVFKGFLKKRFFSTSIYAALAQKIKRVIFPYLCTHEKEENRQTEVGKRNHLHRRQRG